ncbi:MAG: hypothetical protein GY870_03610, partial [archaeon]|nr:hypothetical protein [archaeon]
FLAITFSMQLAISNIYFGFIFGWIWFETKSLPLLGWMHQLYDMIRDNLVFFVLGFSGSIWFTSSTVILTLIAMYPAYLIAKKEGSWNSKLKPANLNS